MIIQPNPAAQYLALKTTNQNVFDTTYTDDSELAHVVAMDNRYRFDLFVAFRLLGATSGYKFRLSAPGDALSEVLGDAQVFDGALNVVANVKVDANAPFALTGALGAGLHTLHARGTIQIATGFSGKLQFQFAQNVLDVVNAIRVLNRSYLEIEGWG